VGTGPYRIAKFEQGKSATFERNTSYIKDGPKGTPSIGRMMFRNIPDPPTQVAELLAGGLDWVWRVPPEQLDSIAATSGLAVATGGTMRTYWLGFDTRSGPFRDARIRRAVAHAIDRQALAEEIMGKGTKLLDVPCYPTQFGCPDPATVKPIEHDLAKARSLLKEAGVGNGFSTKLVLYNQGSNRTLGQAVQGNLGEIGIKAAMDVTTIKAFFDAVQQGTAPLMLQSYGQYNINDVAIILPDYFGGSSVDPLKDPQLIQWFKEALGTGDEVRRKALYEQGARRMLDETFVVPLFIQNVNYAFSKDLAFTPWNDEDPRFFMTHWK
jgi:peptide/nickel transport system substrate-binding protein